jgi:hypothetical protein
LRNMIDSVWAPLVEMSMSINKLVSGGS